MAGFVQELKRRKVFRVAAVYAVSAWVLIQIADVVLPTFGAPEWVNQTLIFLFVIGLIPTLIAAWAYEVTPDGVRPDAGVTVPAPVTSSTDRRLIYIILALVSLLGGMQVTERFFLERQAAVMSTGGLADLADPDAAFSRRSYINLGPSSPHNGSYMMTHFTLSADGRELIYSTLPADSAMQAPELRSLVLNQLDTRQLNNIDGPPYFSPDGDWVAFIQGNNNGIYKAPVRGGGAQMLVQDVRGGTGMFWSDDGYIYFTSPDRVLMRISENGGVPESLGIPMAAGDTTQSHPFLLPDGNGLLFSVREVNEQISQGRIDLLNVASGEVSTLVREGYNPGYVPSGHILFMCESDLWAVPFDAGRMEITGSEVPVIQGVQADGERGGAGFAVSDSGLLAYLPGGDTKGADYAKTLVWVDEMGTEEELDIQRDFRQPRVSPDGRRLAAVIVTEGVSDIWVYDLERDSLGRLTFEEGNKSNPLWTPDGERIVYGKTVNGRSEIWWRAADGTGQEEMIGAGVAGFPNTITPDSAQLIYSWAGDIYQIGLANDGQPQALLAGTSDEFGAELSPDGRWLAYVSNESGTPEVYVRPFPNIDSGKYQVSYGGGSFPRWHPDGNRLFYRRQDAALQSVWVVDIEFESGFRPSSPYHVFSGDYFRISSIGGFDMAPDGSRFLMIRSLGGDYAQDNVQLVLVDNWFAELQRLAPPDLQ